MKQVLELIKEADKSNSYEYYSEGATGEVCLVLCGCPCTCAKHDFCGDEIRTCPGVGETVRDVAKRVLSVIKEKN